VCRSVPDHYSYTVHETLHTSRHDALPIYVDEFDLLRDLGAQRIHVVAMDFDFDVGERVAFARAMGLPVHLELRPVAGFHHRDHRSEENTYELQSRVDVIYRLMLEILQLLF